MSGYPVGATATTFEVVEALAATEQAGVTEIATRLDLSKGSAYNHLATLEALGYVVRSGDEYRLGLRFLDLGARVQDSDDAYRAARSEVRQLADSSGETAWFVVEEAGDAVILYRTDDEAETELRDGTRVPLHASAGGKALLAHEPRSVVESLFDADPAAPTDQTITDERTLVHELQTVRDQGLAFDRGELRPDRRAVAVPVVTDDGSAVGAVGVSGPTDRMSGKRLEEDMPGLVLSAANKIEVEYITD
jgi:DNA-binding IclR family transcriptional regulator